MLKGKILLSKSSLFTNTHRFGSSLVIIEHNNANIDPINLSVVTAAKQFGNITALVAGSSCKSIAEEVAKIEGISKVHLIDKPELKNGLPEYLCPYVVNAQKTFNFTHIFAPSSAFGRNIIPRTAIHFECSPINDIIGIESETIFKRAIYAGNAIVRLESLDPIKFITARGTSFAPSTSDTGKAEIVVDEIKCDMGETTSEFISQELVKSDRPELTAAKIVVSGGRAFKDKEKFQLVYDLADKLGAAVGASRAAVDAGFCSNEIQIGQTGKIVAPELYIAIGISGAIQHMAGMKDSKIIVSINKDGDAPIFQSSDYGLVGDLFTILPELIQKV